MKVKRVALTSLAVAAFTLFAGQAQALGLGRLNVQSALGEALRAEIDVTSLAADEASSLQIRIASPETYRAAGVEYHPALASARVVLARRADGRPFLRVSSDRVVTEPFVDVILEMNWATGRLVREYTLLLDPPRGGAPAGGSTAPIVAAAPPPAQAPAAVAPAPVATPAPVAPAPSAPVVAAPAPAPDPVPVAAAAPAPTPAPAPAAAAQRRPVARAAAPAPAPAMQQAAAKASEVRVRSGDTLTGIAQRVQPSGVSLDQLLVSMYRANPQAFTAENMNRLRTGAILKVPDASEAQNVPPGEARSVILAQSADFNAYRRRLATSVASAPDSTPSRQGSGKVQASVDDRKQAAAPAPDKLKLSQGAVKASAPEAKISRDSASKDASTRVAELSRNLDDLKKVQGAATAAAGTTAKPSAAAPASSAVGIPVPGPTVAPPTKVAAAPTPAPAPAPVAPPAPPAPVKPPVVASAPAPAPVLTPTPPPAVSPAPMPTAAASAAASAAMPSPTAIASAPMPAASAPTVMAAKPASAPPVATAPKPPVSMPQEAEEPGLLAKIMESPFVLPFGAVLAAALAGFGIYRVRSRSSKTAGETSFMESRLQPDSFFGASGGQRVDTHEGGGGASTVGTASSMNYSLSQLDAIGDVDPVAEADVYLAYGRDLQAEEILKEAMRTDPGRLAVRTKLLEVYAKRRDVKGFELLANQLFTLTRGEGADWSKAQELGRSIDPENPLYRSGGRPEDAPDEDQFVEPLGASTMPHSVMPSASNFGTPNDLVDVEPDGVSVSDVDIDLTFDADELDEPPRRDRNAPMDATMPFTPANLASMSASRVAADDIIDVEATERRGPAAEASKESLDFDLSDLSLDLDPPSKAAAPATPAASFKDSEPAPASGFVDLSGLPDDPDSRFNDDGDPLERKLDLADEFRQIGDLEGARDLLNEVIEQADGALKQKAQTMLDSLG